LNIQYIQEKRFDDCKHINTLPFDFYLPDYDICIEFDGIQHFEEISFFNTNDSFDNIQKRDDIKTKYCLDNNIKLIRIKYSDIVLDKLKFLEKFKIKENI